MINIEDIPHLFERYELVVVIVGIVVVFLISGFVFYSKGYKTTDVLPEVAVKVPRINKALFDQIIKDLEEKKQIPPSQSVIDPFR